LGNEPFDKWAWYAHLNGDVNLSMPSLNSVSSHTIDHTLIRLCQRAKLFGLTEAMCETLYRLYQLDV